MPKLIVENVPAETYERLQEWAAAERRSVPDEALHLLTQVVRQAPSPMPRLPDFVPGQETPPPFDLPRSSQSASVTSHRNYLDFLRGTAGAWQGEFERPD